MTFAQLYYFVICADSGAILTAASRLFVSQQALSTSIQNLEKELGVSLFQRSRKGISLTEDGKYLYTQARSLLKTYQDIGEHFGEAEPLSDTISIACNYKHKEFLFTDTLSYFFLHHPDVNVNFQILEKKETLSLVQNGEVDFGIITTGYGVKRKTTLPKDIVFIPLIESTLSCIVSKDSIYTRNKTVSIYELQNQKIILNRSANYKEDIFYQIISAYNSEVNAFWADNSALFHALIRDGAGIGLALETEFHSSSSLKMIPIKEKIVVQTGIIRHINTQPTPSCQRFIQHLCDNAGKYI
ncbi:MAG: LysR family transcriptional regulator [Peptococcaceae bacterium]|nr:LysR family transcriptional regulator [Peptococcaceae bacterium]MBO5114705.1 LysR family transcriptional regulator [Peptococcaceae bacterium]MBO5301980.1 LysR family transcriptional regulator [Peptococcaceae bacterium]MBO5366858.1 LysR family transcriptional regulator [Peptococcaceae bacterium]MBP3625880.1 LysR family transcriptional regulator [Peptococcaceae bacterium]